MLHFLLDRPGSLLAPYSGGNSRRRSGPEDLLTVLSSTLQSTEARKRTMRAISRACLMQAQFLMVGQELRALVKTHRHDWRCGDMQRRFFGRSSSATRIAWATPRAAERPPPRHPPPRKIPSGAEIQRLFPNELIKQYRFRPQGTGLSAPSVDGLLAQRAAERTLRIQRG